MTEKPRGDLVTGSVSRHLVRMTIPMVGGVFAMSAFNVADTYFVAQLGTLSLAAISFTFPVIMVVAAMAWGMGIGAATVVSRAIGQGDTPRVRRLATDSLLLAICSVASISLVGLLTIDPLFRALGASDEILPMIREYIVLWYATFFVLELPMVCNNCIRATGDTLRPAIIMVALALLNVILDPILIFGWGPIPGMGIFGAALATAISRACGVPVSLYLMTRRYHLLSWAMPRLRETLTNWGLILRFAAPASATNMLMPLAMGFVTRLVAEFGPGPVAGVGAGGRVVHFFYIIPIALGSTLLPFVGQNWGAGNIERSGQAWRMAIRFGLYYGLGSIVLFTPLSQPIARIFSDDPNVIYPLIGFVMIVMGCSALQHTAVHSGFVLTAMGRPLTAMLFNGLRIIALMIPLTWLGSRTFGLYGIFAGMAVSFVIAGLAVRFYVPRVMRRCTDVESV